MSALDVDVLRQTFAHNERIRVMKHHQEKYSGRRSPIDPIALESVRKNLFPEVELSPSPNLLFVEQELRRIEILEKERWNFDFINEKPLSDIRGIKWEAYVKPQVKHLANPKPRRVGQGKITDYMCKKKGVKRSLDGKPTFRDVEVQVDSSQMQID